jgi:hypothetical protein
MKRLMFAVAATAALSLSACATPTLYQPATKANSGQGYTEQQIETGRWRVSFSGNSVTSRQTVESYMLFRAAELTVQNGFDWFETVDRATQQQTSYFGTPDPWWGRYGPYWRPYWRTYRGGAWGAWGPGWGADWDVNEITRFEAGAEIVMHHGAKPADNPRAFDARDVMANIGPHVVRQAPAK